jgi:DNA-binding NarL/FixJ family response regulator
MNMRTHGIKIPLLDSDQMIRQGLRQLIATKPDLSVVGEARHRNQEKDER